MAKKRHGYHILWYREKTPPRAGLKSDSIKTRIETVIFIKIPYAYHVFGLKSDSIKTRIETAAGVCTRCGGEMSEK